MHQFPRAAMPLLFACFVFFISSQPSHAQLDLTAKCSLDIPFGDPETRPILVDCNETMVNSFCTAFLSSDYGGTATETDLASTCDGCGTTSATCTKMRVATTNITTVVLCADKPRGVKLECPKTHPVVLSTCGSMVKKCDSQSIPGAQVPCEYYGIRCGGGNDGPPVQEYTCEWRATPKNGRAICQSGPTGEEEVLSGLCLGTRQKECGGQPYGSAFRCCLLRQQGCVEKESWRFINDGRSCPRQTGAQGVCSVRCDSEGYFSAQNPTNPGMFACEGRLYTRDSSTWTSGCEKFPTCPPQSVMTRYTQCLDASIGAGTKITCENVSYAVVADHDCLDVRSNDLVFCPAQHYITGLCAPFAVGLCEGGVDTVARCCKVRSYANLGKQCTPGYVETVVGDLQGRMRQDVSYGINANASLALTSVGEITGVAACDGSVYAADNTGNAILRANTKTNRLTVAMGVYGHPGYEDSRSNPEEWTTHTTLLNKTYDVAIHAACHDMMFTEHGNHIVRNFLQRPPPSLVEFRAYIAAGIPSTTPMLMTGAQNNTEAYRVTLSAANSAIYRESHKEIYISTVAGILKVDELSGLISYFIGNGVQEGPGVLSTPRVNAKVYFPRQLAMYAEAVMYYGDYDGVSPGGAMYAVTFDRDHVDRMQNIETGTRPQGIAIYQQRMMYYTSSNSHCIYVLDLKLNTGSYFAGSACSTAGFQDRVLKNGAQFSSPNYLSVDDLEGALYVADRGNKRIRRVGLSAIRDCEEGYSPWFDCGECSPGYYGFPRCRPQCTIEDDCNNKASAVSGIPGKCVCHCLPGWAGDGCTYCSRGLDLLTQCTKCSDGHILFPHCRTISVSVSMKTLTISESVLQTKTATITPPPTPTPSLTVTTTLMETHTLSAEKSRTKPPTRTPDPTWSLSKRETFSQHLTETATLLDTSTATHEMTLSQTQSLTETDSVIATATDSQSPTTTWTTLPTLTATLSMSHTVSSNPSLTPTITPFRTPSPTQSWAMLPPIVLWQEPHIDRNVINSDVPSERYLHLTVAGQFETAPNNQVPMADFVKHCAAEIWFERYAFDDTAGRTSFLNNQAPETTPVPIAPTPSPFTFLNTSAPTFPVDQPPTLSPLYFYQRIPILNSAETEVLERVFRNSVVRSMNTSLLQLVLDVPSDEFFNVKDVFVHMRFKAECFVNRMAPASPTVLLVKKLPPPPLLQASVTDAGSALAAIGVAFSAATNGNIVPSMLFAANGLIEVVECRSLPLDHLPWFIHPMYFSLGTGAYKAYVGAATMSFVLAALPLLLHWGVTHYAAENSTEEADGGITLLDGKLKGSSEDSGVLEKLRKSKMFEAMLHSMVEWRFPSYTLLLCKWFLYPAVFSNMALLVAQAKNSTLGYFFLPIWLGFVGIAIYATTKKRAEWFAARWVPLTIIEIPRGLKRLFIPLGHWADNYQLRPKGGFIRQFGPWFEYCRPDGGLFFALHFEVLFLAISGIFHGTFHGIDGSCVVFAILDVILLLALAIMAIGLRPFTHGWNNIVGALVSLLLLAGALCGAAGVTSMGDEESLDDESRKTRRVAAALATAAMYCCSLFLVIPCWKLWQWVQEDPAEREQRLAKEEDLERSRMQQYQQELNGGSDRSQSTATSADQYQQANNYMFQPTTSFFDDHHGGQHEEMQQWGHQPTNTVGGTMLQVPLLDHQHAMGNGGSHHETMTQEEKERALRLLWNDPHPHDTANPLRQDHHLVSPHPDSSPAGGRADPALQLFISALGPTANEQQQQQPAATPTMRLHMPHNGVHDGAAPSSISMLSPIVATPHPHHQQQQPHAAAPYRSFTETPSYMEDVL